MNNIMLMVYNNGHNQNGDLFCVLDGCWVGCSHFKKIDLSICLTVLHDNWKYSATSLIGSRQHSRAALSASRCVTRAYFGNQGNSSSFGPHSGQATRLLLTNSQQLASNTGNSRIHLSDTSCRVSQSTPHPLQVMALPLMGSSV